jgi:hypothetical protein
MIGKQDFEKELHDRALREVAVWQIALRDLKMKHRLLVRDAGGYEAAVLGILQKHPPISSVVSITLHEAGSRNASYTVQQSWRMDSMSLADIAKLVARTIMDEGSDNPGKVFDGVTLDFATSQRVDVPVSP